MRFGKHADPSTVISIAKRSFVPHVCRNAIKEKKTKQCLYLILGCSIYIWSVSWDWGTPRPLLVICQIWLIFKFNNMGFGQSLPFFIAHPFPPFYLSSYLSIYLSIQLSIYLSIQPKQNILTITSTKHGEKWGQIYSVIFIYLSNIWSLTTLYQIYSLSFVEVIKDSFIPITVFGLSLTHCT